MIFSSIEKILYLIAPIVLAGVFNMIFVKLPILNNLKIPIDNGKVLKDGRRLFGDNKTWKGFWGMIVFTSFWFIVSEFLVKNFLCVKELSLIPFDSFNFPFSAWLFGAIWGFAYVFAELPNSYAKRRLNIEPGKKGSGFLGYLFYFIDQGDSVIGCLIALPIFYKASFADAFAIFIIGSAVHLLTNLVLYKAKLKREV